jgi:hypothetical protein
MLNAWAFVWLCGLKVFLKKLEKILDYEKKMKKTKPNPHHLSIQPKQPTPSLFFPRGGPILLNRPV